MKVSKVMMNFAGLVRGEVNDWVRNQFNDPDTQITVRPFKAFVIVMLQHEQLRIEYAVDRYMTKEPRLLLLLENYKKLHGMQGRLRIKYSIEND